MASEIKVDTIVNAGGDNDSGIDLSTNDQVKVNIANAQAIKVTGTQTDIKVSASRELNILKDSSDDALVLQSSAPDASNNLRQIELAGNIASFSTGASSGTSATERMRIDDSGNVIVANTSLVGTGNNTNSHIELRETGTIVISANSTAGMAISRGSDDGQIVQLQQAGTVEGTISVSGSTVSYNGFTGLHESSGIATNAAIGTVVSTIDELDVYSNKQLNINTEEDNPKAGQTRPNHPKVKVSDTIGDKAVYGVVNDFNEQGKVNVASVGVGSVRVTGACAKSDLLESNGDGTAKVQSDDIVRSKTIGKVTIGNSNSGVKLVSCVLYCG